MMRKLLPMLALMGAGYAITRMLQNGGPGPAERSPSDRRLQGRQGAAAMASPRFDGSGRTVRPAGPVAMTDPPRDWDRVDESSDESFPASDASAKY